MRVYFESVSSGAVHVLAANIVHLHSTDYVTEGGEGEIILWNSSNGAASSRGSGAGQGGFIGYFKESKYVC